MSKVKFILQIVCLMCLAVLMSVSLITHHSGYRILIFTTESKTYHAKKITFKNLCLLSLKKSLYCPLEGIQ